MKSNDCVNHIIVISTKKYGCYHTNSKVISTKLYEIYSIVKKMSKIKAAARSISLNIPYSQKYWRGFNFGELAIFNKPPN